MRAEWIITNIGSIVDTNIDTYSKKDKWSFVNYLDTGNITENRITKIQHLVVGKDKIPSRAKRKVKTNDIIFSTVRPNQKHYGKIKKPFKNMLVSTGFTTLRVKKNGLDIDFIYWFITQPKIINHLQMIGEHTASTYPSIKPSDIESLEISLPPFEEQKAISFFLNSLDDKIELNRQTNKTLEAMAQALFKSWFVDFDPVIDNALAAGNPIPEMFAERAKLRAAAKNMGSQSDSESAINGASNYQHLFPAEFEFTEEMGWVPKGWNISNIGSEVTTVGGGTPSTKETKFWESGDICWTTPKDLSGNQTKILTETARKITSLGLSKISSGLLPIDTVLMSSRAPVGYLAFAKVPIAINQGYIAMKCEKTITPEFAIQWASSEMDEIKQHASGTTFAEISKKSFREIPVLVPDVKSITEYSKVVRDNYSQITHLELNTKTLTKLRDTLLPKLLSGELRIPDAEKIIQASV